MATVPPPQGMSEVDYEAIEAAVTETVRGRWFLNEFARRNRAAEMRQVLDAIGRIEGVVASGQAALPPADPSIRLLMQRIKEIAGQLDMLSMDMREAGVDERYAAAVEKEARAVSGMMRGPAQPRATLGTSALPRSVRPAPVQAGEPRPDPPQTGSPQHGSPQRGSLQAAPITDRPRSEPTGRPGGDEISGLGRSNSDDPRLVALAGLDDLPLAEKLVLFA